MAQRRCARKNLSVLISLCPSLSTISLSAKGAEFSHERDLPPLTLAATELDNVLRKAQSLIAAAEAAHTFMKSGRVHSTPFRLAVAGARC
jgi:hypothetical protein